jgi:myosin protein heavy chain
LLSTFEPEVMSPDEVARDNFAQRCKVVMSVTSGRADLLPLDTLRMFCETTDAPLECRIRLVGRLTEVTKRGESVWDFCLDTYQWFQDNYGQYCPKQCHKLQCQNTCEWLKTKKMVDAQGKAIKKEKFRLESLESAVASLNSSKKEAEQAQLDQERAIEQAQTNEKRAKEKLEENTKKQEAAQKKVDERNKRISELIDDQKKTEEEVSEEGKKLTDLKFMLDFGNQNTSQALAKVTRLEEKLAEHGAELEELEEQLEKADAELEEMATQEKNSSSRLDELSKEWEEDNATAEKWKGEVEEAEKRLKEAQAEGKNTTKDDFAQYEDLVKQQKERLREAQNEAFDIKREMNREENLRDYATNNSAQITESNKKLNAKREAAQKSVKETEGDLDAARDHHHKVGNATLKLAEEVRAQQEVMTEKEEELAKVGRTLEFEEGVLSEEQAALDEASAGVSKAQGQLMLAEDTIKSGQRELEKRKNAVKKLDEEIKEQNGQFSNGTAELDEEASDYKEAYAKLVKSTPEIVHQHGLSLLSFSKH